VPEDNDKDTIELAEMGIDLTAKDTTELAQVGIKKKHFFADTTGKSKFFVGRNETDKKKITLSCR